MFGKLKVFAKSLKAEIAVLASAIRDPRTPWTAKLLGIVIVAYAVSPIDLIPDFIPVLGYLDELILLPLGLWTVRALIPADVIAEHRAKVPPGTRLAASRAAALFIVLIWIGALALTVHWLWGRLS